MSALRFDLISSAGMIYGDSREVSIKDELALMPFRT